MKKVILSLDVYDDNGRQKAMKIVSGLSGVDSMSIDMKEKKLTIIGDVDAVVIVSKLRRRFHNTAIVSVGPSKEPEKKKEEPKKEETKKIPDVKVAEFVNAYRGYTPHYSTSHYYVPSMEDNPNACVIC